MVDTAGMENEFSLASFLEETHKDYEQTQRDLKEIDILIKQSAAEVERLAQRNSQATSYTRQLQTNFETLPREDIKEAYEAMNDVQQRLFTMRGQLEKLQSDQRNLERLAEFQRKIIELTDGATPLPSSGGRRRTSGEQPNVIRVIQTEEAVRQGLVRKMHDSVASSYQ